MRDESLMKSDKKVSIISCVVLIFIFLLITLWGKLFLKDGDEIGYVVMSFYIIMTIASLVVGIVLGVKDAYLKWTYPILSGILGITIPAFVFKGSWEWISILFSLVPSMAGLALGVLINKKRNKVIE